MGFAVSVEYIESVITAVALAEKLLVPALIDARRLYDPSIAASKDRIVSSGRSNRGRVGFDRSGSAG